MMQNVEFDRPIKLKILLHTGKIDGDDSAGEKSSGYRNVRVKENNDPMVEVTGVECIPVYWIGAVKGFCTYYPHGLGGAQKILVRKPVLYQLQQVNEGLQRKDRTLVVLDGWRDYLTQVELWKYLRQEEIESRGLVGQPLGIQQEVEIGMKADEIGSYCAAVENEIFARRVEDLLVGARAEEVAKASESIGQPANEIAKLYLTFLANVGEETDITLSESAVTAHGGGGAVDVWMRNTLTGTPVNLGVPFDYIPRAGCAKKFTMMDAFEGDTMDIYEAYHDEVAADQTLQRYLGELGIERVTMNVVYEIRRERQALFNAMTQIAGASIYYAEPWHFNVPPGEGEEDSRYPGAGNGCHSLLKDIRDENGELVAIWGNEVGHRFARAMLGR